jgi:hypothetical protein
VDVVPLADPAEGSLPPGWVSYVDPLLESPDVEILAGGLNAKTPNAAALWRQGHLLHFGFDLSPAQMNGCGRSLLENAIVYVARFTQDRAILEVPSPFAGQGYRSRASLAAWLANEKFPLEWFRAAIDPTLLAEAGGETRADLSRWFEGIRGFLRPNDEGKLAADEEAESLDLPFDRIEAFERAIPFLEGERSSAARALLSRIAPAGPGPAASAAAWQAWFAENRPYLFWSDWGGYRWTVDPLAKARRIPTAELRGPARAEGGDLR